MGGIVYVPGGAEAVKKYPVPVLGVPIIIIGLPILGPEVGVAAGVTAAKLVLQGAH